MASSSQIRTLQESQYNHLGWTNNILVHQARYKKVYFIPAYLRIKCKNFIQMDFKNLVGSANIDLIFSVFYGGLSDKAVQQLKTNIILRFNKGKPLLLKESLDIQLVNNIFEKTLRFTVRKLAAAQLDVDILWAPFQIIRYVMSVAVGKISFSHEGENYEFNFNLMGNQGLKIMQANYTEDSYFGQYDLAQNLVQTQYSNWNFYSKLQAAKSQTQQSSYKKYKQSIKYDRGQSQTFLGYGDEVQQNVEELKIEAFHYAHFIFPLYRKPFPTLLNLFFPVILLSIINLAIFFQNDGIAKRVQNIAIVLVSYTALIPTIRDTLPPNDKVTFSEVLIFAFAFTTILAFIHTIQTRNLTDYHLDWKNQGLFLAAMGITIVCTGLLIYMSLLHLIYYQKMYNKQAQKDNFKFIRTDWTNKKCDEYFKYVIQNGYQVNQVQNKDNRISKMILQI